MVELTVNGAPRVIRQPEDRPLLWVLRHDLGLRGTKYGCGVGKCGACTVHLDGRPVPACTTELKECAGRAVTTIEGLAAHETDPVLRAWVDEHMSELIRHVSEEQWEEVALRIAIGLNHEQQHQELLLTDIKHNFWVNPLFPAYRDDLQQSSHPASALGWHAFEGGLASIGQQGEGFAYDNEWPRHTVYVQPWRLANRLVSNGEYAAFIADGGYERPELWLSDGWAAVQKEGWQAPLYWLRQEGEWWNFTLRGLRSLNEAEPVAHLSYYEAEAYARWAGHRLPTEQERELAAAQQPLRGNLRETDRLHPLPARGEGLQQLYGDLWEWTASPYTPYPGYRAPSGAIGEYNGKFMCNQMVLRGGSCVTPGDHIRASYRNFFYPDERWQFKGLRLAEDAS